MNYIDNPNVRLKVLGYLSMEDVAARAEGVSLKEIQDAICATATERYDVDRLLAQQDPSFIASQSVRVGNGFDTRYFITTEGYKLFKGMQIKQENHPAKVSFFEFLGLLFQWKKRK